MVTIHYLKHYGNTFMKNHLISECKLNMAIVNIASWFFNIHNCSII